MNLFSRKLLTTTTATAAAMALAACGSEASEDAAEGPIVILASATPHTEILEWVDEQHDEFELDVKVIPGGPEVNMSTADGSADLNYYQHTPYLQDWNKETGNNLESFAGIHIEPMAMYSEKYSSIDEIPDGSTIAVPRSASDFARALLLLEHHGLLSLDEELDPTQVTQITEASIVDNPKNLEFLPVEDQIAIQSVTDPQVAGAVASSNFAMQAGYNPTEDAVISEEPEGNPYVNIVVGQPGTEDSPQVQALLEALQSKETADWIREEFNGAVVPVNQE